MVLNWETYPACIGLKVKQFNFCKFLVKSVPLGKETKRKHTHKITNNILELNQPQDVWLYIWEILVIQDTLEGLISITMNIMSIGTSIWKTYKHKLNCQKMSRLWVVGRSVTNPRSFIFKWCSKVNWYRLHHKMAVQL